MVHKGSDVSIGTQPEEESMQGDQMIETTDYFKAQLQRNYEFQDKGSEAMLLLGMDKLNSLRGTIDGNLIGRDPAHVLKKRLSRKDEFYDLIKDCEHSQHIESKDSK